MLLGSVQTASNRSDFHLVYDLLSVDDNEALDLSGASITTTVYDAAGCDRLTLSTSTGEVTMPDDGTIYVLVPVATFSALNAGRYQVSTVMTRDGLTEEIARNYLTVTGDE